MGRILLALVAAILSQVVCGTQTSLPASSLGPLTTSGAKYVSTDIQKASNALNAAVKDVEAHNAACQKIKDAKTKNQCVPCIVNKCKAKAESCNRKLSISGTIGTIAEIGHKVTSTVKDVGNKIVSGIKHIFHGWGKRQVKRAEPSCSDIEHNSGTACQKYESACPTCTFNPDAECAGYARAHSVYTTDKTRYAWLSKVPKTGATYQVTQVTYDAASFDPKTQTYKDVHAHVAILGKSTSFKVSHPINVFLGDKAGPVIASQAMAWFKTH